MTSLIGQSLGRYHILEQLGQGGMATVYKAFDTRLERTVVVKVILQQIRQDASFIKRFEVEAKILAQLSHPYIVKILDYGEQDGTPYLVMEYIPGGTLRDRLGRRLPYAQAAKLLVPITEALAYAHGQNIIHRDVKPANILLGAHDEPLLTDFGIAKLLETGTSTHLTGTGMGLGTPAYSSPEQGLGRTVDQRTDIYALGVVFFELVTGHAPFSADTPMAIVLQHVHDPLPRPKSLVPELPDEVEQALIKALAKKPEDRYPTMQAFGAVLEGFARQLPPAGAQSATLVDPPATLVVKAAPAHRHLPRGYLIGGALAVVLACALCASSGVLFASRGWLNSLRGSPTASVSAGALVVKDVTGEATFSSGGGAFRVVAKGDRLTGGLQSVLRTAVGEVELSLRDGAVAYVGPQTEVVFEELGAIPVRLTLRQGKLLAVVQLAEAGAAPSFIFQVPYGAQAQARYATLGAEYDPVSSRFDLDCLGGTCALVDADGQLLQKLAAGQHTWVDSAGGAHATDAIRGAVWNYAGLAIPGGPAPTSTTSPMPSTTSTQVAASPTAISLTSTAQPASPTPSLTSTAQPASPTPSATSTATPVLPTRTVAPLPSRVPPTRVPTLVPPTPVPPTPIPPTPIPPTDTPVPQPTAPPPPPPTSTPIPALPTSTPIP